MDSYQPIYDAVRSKIFNGDIGCAVERAIGNQDIGHRVQQALYDIVAYQCAPHVLMRPRIFPDGSAWCALYGDNLQDGVAGFGKTPAEACSYFDANWNKELQKPDES